MKIVAQCVMLIASILCASCERPAIDPSQSLVDAKELPTARSLSLETIHLNRGFGGDGFGTHLLSYELRPDNTLAVTHYERGEKGEVVRDTETFRLSKDLAERARNRLWRMRPRSLDGAEFETRPTGCKPQWDHDFGEFAVAFIRDGGQDGVQDDKVGVFVLPEPGSCNNSAAKEARALILQVLGDFPQSKVVKSFNSSEKSISLKQDGYP